MNWFSSRFSPSLALLTGWLVQSACAASTPVRVMVSASQTNDSLTYCYQVVNNSTTPINNFVVGSVFDPTSGGSFPELGKLPKGWYKGSQGETGVAIILVPASTNQPSGWAASAYGQEGTAFYYLAWKTRGGVGAIRPGQTASDFCVTVQKGNDPNLIRMPPGSDWKYLTGHFGVSLPSGNEVHGDIEPLDVTPPSLSLRATPDTLWPPNGKAIPITIAVSATDDYDALPQIRLQSIVANEPTASGDISNAAIGTDDRQFSLAAVRAGASTSGRTYTVTYSAVDASGNTATAAIDVVVPHDQKH
jgi:hypothetical protein